MDVKQYKLARKGFFIAKDENGTLCMCRYRFSWGESSQTKQYFVFERYSGTEADPKEKPTLCMGEWADDHEHRILPTRLEGIDFDDMEQIYAVGLSPADGEALLLDMSQFFSGCVMLKKALYLDVSRDDIECAYIDKAKSERTHSSRTMRPGVYALMAFAVFLVSQLFLAAWCCFTELPFKMLYMYSMASCPLWVTPLLFLNIKCTPRKERNKMNAIRAGLFISLLLYNIIPIILSPYAVLPFLVVVLWRMLPHWIALPGDKRHSFGVSLRHTMNDHLMELTVSLGVGVFLGLLLWERTQLL